MTIQFRCKTKWNQEGCVPWDSWDSFQFQAGSDLAKKQGLPAYSNEKLCALCGFSLPPPPALWKATAAAFRTQSPQQVCLCFSLHMGTSAESQRSDSIISEGGPGLLNFWNLFHVEHINRDGHIRHQLQDDCRPVCAF